MLRACAIALALVLATATGVAAQTAIPPAGAMVTGFFSTSTTGATPWIPLNGQSSCAVTFTSPGAGTPSITVQGASDAPNAGTITANTVTTFGTSGTITSPSAGSVYIGGIAGSALTYIRLNVTQNTGTLSGSVTCTAALARASGGTGGAQVYAQRQTCSVTNQTLTSSTWGSMCTVTFSALGTSAGSVGAWWMRVFASGGSGATATTDGICVVGASAGTQPVALIANLAQNPACPGGLAAAPANALAGNNRGVATASAGIGLWVNYEAQYANGATPAYSCYLIQAAGQSTNACNVVAVAEPI